MNATVNQNISECLRSVNDIGSTTVINICNGTKTVVPWGAVDWLTAAVLGALTVVALVLVAFFVTMTVATR